MTNSNSNSKMYSIPPMFSSLGPDYSASSSSSSSNSNLSNSNLTNSNPQIMYSSIGPDYSHMVYDHVRYNDLNAVDRDFSVLHFFDYQFGQPGDYVEFLRKNNLLYTVPFDKCKNPPIPEPYITHDFTSHVIKHGIDHFPELVDQVVKEINERIREEYDKDKNFGIWIQNFNVGVEKIYDQRDGTWKQFPTFGNCDGFYTYPTERQFYFVKDKDLYSYFTKFQILHTLDRINDFMLYRGGNYLTRSRNNNYKERQSAKIKNFELEILQMYLKTIQTEFKKLITDIINNQEPIETFFSGVEKNRMGLGLKDKLDKKTISIQVEEGTYYADFREFGKESLLFINNDGQFKTILTFSEEGLERIHNNIGGITKKQSNVLNSILIIRKKLLSLTGEQMDTYYNWIEKKEKERKEREAKEKIEAEKAREEAEKSKKRNFSGISTSTEQREKAKRRALEEAEAKRRALEEAEAERRALEEAEKEKAERRALEEKEKAERASRSKRRQPIIKDSDSDDDDDDDDDDVVISGRKKRKRTTIANYDDDDDDDVVTSVPQQLLGNTQLPYRKRITRSGREFS